MSHVQQGYLEHQPQPTEVSELQENSGMILFPSVTLNQEQGRGVSRQTHFSSGSLQLQRESAHTTPARWFGLTGPGLAAVGDESISGSLHACPEVSSCCHNEQLGTAGHSPEPRGSLGATGHPGQLQAQTNTTDTARHNGSHAKQKSRKFVIAPSPQKSNEWHWWDGPANPAT